METITYSSVNFLEDNNINTKYCIRDRQERQANLLNFFDDVHKPNKNLDQSM